MVVSSTNSKDFAVMEGTSQNFHRTGHSENVSELVVVSAIPVINPRVFKKYFAAASSMNIMKIVMFLFSLIGLGVFVSALLQILRAFKCLNWPNTSGTIVNTTIKITGGRNGVSTTRAGSSYLPVITYNYEVHGKQYTNNIRCFGDFGAGEARAKGILSRYIQDETVEVAYNPHDANISVLETNVKMGLLLPMIIGLIMAGIGMYAFFYKFQ